MSIAYAVGYVNVHCHRPPAVEGMGIVSFEAAE